MKKVTLFQIARNNEFEQNFAQNMMASVMPMGQYVPVCKLEAVCTLTFTFDDDALICERMFGLLQDECAKTNHCNYSMSVGDVLNIGTEWYRCVANGFVCITGELGATGTVIVEKEESTMTSTTTNNATINNNTTVQEEVTMNETIIINGTEEERVAMAAQDVAGDTSKVMGTIGNIYQGLKAGKDAVNRTKAKVVEDINDDVETIKGGIGSIVGILDVLGLTALKANIERIMYAGIDNAGQGKTGSLTNMAEECTAIIHEEIQFLKLIGDEASLKQAASLKAFVTEDGKVVRSKNIFELIAATLYWLARKVMKKMSEWFYIPQDKMPKVLSMLFCGIKMLLDLILAGVRIVLYLSARAIGFVIAAGVKLGAFVVNTVKTLFGKVKGFTEQVANTLDTIAEEKYSDFDDYEEDEYFA